MDGSRQRGRARAPRVQITYDLDAAGESRRKELPFVLGVLGDFAGQPEKPLPKLRERQFVEVSRGNLSAVLRNLQPRVALSLDNKLAGDGSKLAVTLRFQCLEDFEPEHLAQQVEPMRRLIAVRRDLSALRSSLRKQPQLADRVRTLLRTERPAAPDNGTPASLPHDRTDRSQ